MKNLTAISLFLLSMIFDNAVAQPYYFNHYRVEDGLSNNTIFSVMQDHRGFMWFGSKEGLIRFDGNTFKTYNDGKFPENIRGFILRITKAQNGYLWIGTRGGIYKFNEQTETFSSLTQLPELEVEDIKTDQFNRLWASVGGKLYRYDDAKGTVKKFSIGTDADVASFTYDQGVIWVCTTTGYIFRCGTLDEEFVCVNPNQQVFKNNQNRIIKIYCDGDVLFIGSTTGLASYDVKRKTFKPIIGSRTLGYPVIVRDVLKYKKDEFWIATETGIFLYNQASDRLVNLKRNYNDPYSLSDNAVYSVFKDREGGMWASTYFGGINYFHPQLSTFKKYFPGSSVNQISGNGVREICKDDYGNLWIGTEDGGLNKVQKDNGRISVFRYVPGGSGISSDNIHGLLANGEELWVGTFERGLDILNIRTGKFVRHYRSEDPSSGLQTNFINVLYKTRKNKIYAGTDKGLYLYVAEKDSFSLVSALPSDSYVTSLLEDHKGTLWVGTIRKGIYYHDEGSPVWGNYQHISGDGNSLSNNMISGIFQDSKNDYWFGTENGGINHLSANRKRFYRFTTAEGLPSNLVFMTLEDRNKNVWMSTSKGLVRFNPKNKSWMIFNKPHGILTDQFNYNSAFEDNGIFYFGTVGGLVSFNPAELQFSSSMPPVYITSFQVDNRELPIDGTILRKSVTYTDTITLNYDQSSFSIGFAALTYIAPLVSHYAYKLEGLDKRWTFLKNNRSVYFTDLSPGMYTFRIRTTNPHQATDLEQKLVIIILKPYWLSFYAILIYAALITYLIYFSVSTYHRRIRIKNRRRLEQIALAKEKEIYNTKIEFFTNVAHEIRTPLTLIKGPLENVIDQVGSMRSVQKNLKSIERNTERLLSLTNQLLDFQRTENNALSLNYEHMDIAKCLSRIANLYAGMATERQLKFDNVLHVKHLQAFIDKEAFTKIIDNLISNALKYAAEQVTLELLPVDDFDKTFMIKVKNDGFLIPTGLKEKIFESFYRIPETEHHSGSGIGLSLARSLAELHGGSLTLEDANKNLNVFVLTLPVYQNVEFNIITN